MGIEIRWRKQERVPPFEAIRILRRRAVLAVSDLKTKGQTQNLLRTSSLQPSKTKTIL